MFACGGGVTTGGAGAGVSGGHHHQRTMGTYEEMGTESHTYIIMIFIFFDRYGSNVKMGYNAEFLDIA